MHSKRQSFARLVDQPLAILTARLAALLFTLYLFNGSITGNTHQIKFLLLLLSLTDSDSRLCTGLLTTNQVFSGQSYARLRSEHAPHTHITPRSYHSQSVHESRQETMRKLRSQWCVLLWTNLQENISTTAVFHNNINQAAVVMLNLL